MKQHQRIFKMCLAQEKVEFQEALTKAGKYYMIYYII